MRSLLTKVLVLLGAFLLTTALLALLWVPGQVKKTPIDVNSVTRLVGEAKLADGDGGTAATPVKATSTTHADSVLSTKDVVLFYNSSCLIKDPDGTAPDCVSADDPDGRLVSAGTDVFATNRKTALPVNDFENLPADAQAKDGLMNKFPFGVEQENYAFWDGVLQRSVEATYQGEETIDGLNTYKFLVDVPDTPAEVSAGIAGHYSSQKTMWIDPVTGSIINQHEQQSRKVRGKPILELDFGFTDETVAANVEAAKENVSRLSLLTSTVPMVGGILGLLALAGGLFLAFTARPRHEAADADGTYADGDEPAYVDETQPVYEDHTDQFFEEAEADVETRRSRRDLQ